jgi:hypothetical protein
MRYSAADASMLMEQRKEKYTGREFGSTGVTYPP